MSVITLQSTLTYINPVLIRAQIDLGQVTCQTDAGYYRQEVIFPEPRLIKATRRFYRNYLIHRPLFHVETPAARRVWKVVTFYFRLSGMEIHTRYSSEFAWILIQVK